MTDLVLMIAGQSNGAQMCRVPVAGCNPVAGTYVWSAGWRAMTASDGAGMIELANTLRSNGYANVYVYDCCHGGSGVVPQTAAPPENHWFNQNPGGPLRDCEDQVDVGGKVPQFVIWIQGEHESGWSLVDPAFDIQGKYKIYLDQLRLFLLARWGVSDAQCVWMVTPVGSPPNYGDIRQAQVEYAESTPGVFLGPPRDDLPLADAVHLSGPGCLIFGDRVAATLLAYLKELEVMTDPQDKAAIASLQAELASIKASLASINTALASIQRSVAGLQYPITNLNTRLSALEVVARDGPIGPYGKGVFSC